MQSMPFVPFSEQKKKQQRKKSFTYQSQKVKASKRLEIKFSNSSHAWQSHTIHDRTILNTEKVISQLSLIQFPNKTFLVTHKEHRHTHTSLFYMMTVYNVSISIQFMVQKKRSRERKKELQLTYAYMNIIAQYGFERFSNATISRKNYVFKIQQWQLEFGKYFRQQFSKIFVPIQ